jgi:hypothetical protein
MRVSSTYDQYIHHPPHLNLSMKSDGTTVFDGNFVTHQQLGYPFAMGHQFVRKPFKGDNPCHTHNFHEVLAWYGGNPEDPDGLLPGAAHEAEQVLMDEHTAPYGTSIACIAMNYADITDLCAEVELWIGGEKHIITKGFWAYIPPNVPVGPMIVRNITEQIFFTMSWPMGEGIAKYPGGR